MDDLMIVFAMLTSVASIALVWIVFRKVMRRIALQERDELEQIAVRGDYYG